MLRNTHLPRTVSRSVKDKGSRKVVHLQLFLALLSASSRRQSSILATRPKNATTLSQAVRFHSNTSHSSSSSPSDASTATANTTPKNPERKCWQCGASLPRSAVFCPVEQGLIQPTYDESTFFDVLVPGTPPQDAKFKFDLDEKKLRRRFLELQTKVHPDGYGRKSATEKVCADQQSSFINKGYQSLKDPLPRAKYLLHMNGLSVGEGDSLDDKSLLMEVMEAREQLEEAATQDEIAYMKEENNERIDRTIQGLSDAFKSRDLQRAKRLTTELQYWINIQNAASDWSPGKRVEINH